MSTFRTRFFPPAFSVLMCCLVATLFVGCSAGKDTPEVTFERGRILADRGQFDDAIPQYTKALKSLPDWPQIYYERARAYEQLNLFEKALEDYSTCLKHDIEFTQAINNKGVVLAKMERFEEAAQEFGHLIAAVPDDILALRNRGLCYHDQGEFDKALADYDTALRMTQDDATTWFQRGNVFLEREEFSEAVANYDKAIALDPEYAKAFMNRGVARYGLAERKAAMEDLAHAQQLDDSIILPGIDWLAAGGDVVEQQTAKPVYLESAGNSDWLEALNAAQTFLSEHGFEDIAVETAVPYQLCGRFSGKQSGRVMEVFVGVAKAEASGVMLPAIDSSQTDPQRALLVLKRSNDDSYVMSQFIENWKPSEAQIQPSLVKVQLTADSDQ